MPPPKPEIVMRIPGRWTEPAALAAALPSGFALEHGRLGIPDGTSVELVPVPPDAEFPAVFAHACGPRCSRRTRRAVRRYAVNACLVGPGGSVDSALRMMHAATGLLEAGGIGIFVDNGLIAHERGRWREIIEPLDTAAIFLGLVNVVRGGNHVRTIGMHVFGQREVVVPERRMSGGGKESAGAMNGRAPESAGDDAHALFDFVEHVASETNRIVDGDFFESGGQWFRVRCAPEPAHIPFRSETPPFNPFGTWMLEPVARQGHA